MVLMVFFQLQDFAAHVDVIFRGEIAVGHGGRDVGDVTNLGGQVAGHGVDGIGQIFPDAADALHFGLTAELAFGTDFARHAGDFGRERVELIHHGVDGVLQLSSFASEVTSRGARSAAPKEFWAVRLSKKKGRGRVWRDLTDSVNSMAGNLTAQVVPHRALRAAVPMAIL